MKSKLLLLLLSRRDTGGFAIVIALAMGLIMVLVGISLMVRSTKQHTHAGASQVTTEGISMTEVGITRIQDFLNRNRFLALYDDCTARSSADNTCPDSPPGPSDPSPSELTWANLTADKLANMALACQSTEISNFDRLVRDGEWIDVEEASHQRQYRLLSYRYEKKDSTQDDYTAPGIGILTLEGRVKQNNDLKVATSRIEVKIPIKETAPETDNIPGVWLLSGGTGNNTIQGDVLLNDCGTNLTDITVTGSDPDTGDDYAAKHTIMEFPDLPYDGNINNIPVAVPRLGTLSGQDYEFPRVGDTPTSTHTITDDEGNVVSTHDVYEYVVDAIDLQSGNHTLTIIPGKRVTFYLQGSIEKGGEIRHSCDDGMGGTLTDCKSTNFQVYGYGTATLTGGDRYKICTIGNKRIEAFILAPQYIAGTAGTGGGTGGIKGSVWANSWSNGSSCGSNTSNTAVVQTGRWEELDGLVPKNMPPKLSGTSSWQRLERD